MRIADELGAAALLGGFVLGIAAVPTMACDGSADPALTTHTAPPLEVVTDAPAGTAQAPTGAVRPGPSSQDLARARFREADTDANGTISREEWRRWHDQPLVDRRD